MTERSLLLLSADIAGSTEYKQAHSNGGSTPEWLEPFVAFFREVPLVLMGKLALAFAEAEHIPELRVWRVAGDEIIFLAEPATAEEALGIVEAFVAMLSDYNARLDKHYNLHLRGGAWAAPLGTDNIGIEILEMHSAAAASGPYRDYLGPDVDSGFRLLKYAPHGHAVISLKLASALAAGDALGQLSLDHADDQPLRGLFGGKPYPVLITGQGKLTATDILSLEERFLTQFEHPSIWRFTAD
ncbi:hypothetical protein GCM10011352_38150 [Marinobacterium zhoushanense]|uniref:Class 3 adenylate cyclase n=1 Tax=Marinobacterium zhoushanense TaxID=1679163 RepID=A0ABQ1KTS6_9GAMM|nr:hypothetical protein [Marinobacterium zhoushanense]GGC08176.1 hypothetical protein GCM10011352_38150 [Marinobacterium zhoushanense]